jgi:hypothetical protein
MPLWLEGSAAVVMTAEHAEIAEEMYVEEAPQRLCVLCALCG